MKIQIENLKKHPFNKIFGDLQGEEFEALKRDIKKRGMQTTIDITPDNTIICGHQRVRACKSLGISEVNARVLNWNESELKEHLIKDNILRRQLTPFQIVEAGKELEKIYEGRKGAHVDKRPYEKKDVGATRDLVSKDFGISGRTYERYKKTYNKLKEDNREDLIEEGKKDAKKFKEANKIIKEKIHKEKIEKQEQEIAKINKKIIVEKKEKEYDIVVIDPPWNYGREYDAEGSRVANPYPEMNYNDIKNDFLNNIKTKPNSIIFLWTTHKFIEDAIHLLKEWGFEYKATMVWDKEKMGMGSWVRMQCEFCLLGIKGRPTWDIKDMRDIMKEPRTQHSSKPNILYDMINKYFNKDYFKMDYFARKKREGWDVFGDEVKE